MCVKGRNGIGRKRMELMHHDARDLKFISTSGRTVTSFTGSRLKPRSRPRDWVKSKSWHSRSSFCFSQILRRTAMSPLWQWSPWPPCTTWGSLRLSTAPEEDETTVKTGSHMKTMLTTVASSNDHALTRVTRSAVATFLTDCFCSNFEGIKCAFRFAGFRHCLRECVSSCR